MLSATIDCRWMRDVLRCLTCILSFRRVLASPREISVGVVRDLFPKTGKMPTLRSFSLSTSPTFNRTRFIKKGLSKEADSRKIGLSHDFKHPAL